MKSLIFLLILPNSLTYNYCSDSATEKLCPGGKHIACCSEEEQMSCISDGKEVPHDKGKVVYPPSPKFIDMILEKHNCLRNKIACGIGNYSTDSGESLPIPDFMYEIVWNLELAANAKMLLQNCIYGHSKCHKTYHFPCSGQNLGMGTSMDDNRDFAMNIIDAWFSEYAFLPNITDLKVFTGKANPESKSVGHFTAMSKDDQTHIGCAMVKCKSSSQTTILFGCNYSQTNMVGAPTYTYSADSKPGKMCEKKSERYKCLCAR